MNRFSNLLEIRIHLADGTTTRFAQQDAHAARRILRDAQPARLFAGEALLLGDHRSMVAIHTSKVTRVDFLTDLRPDWPLPLEVLEIQEITREEFERRCRSESARGELPAWMTLGRPAAPVFVKVELSGGEQVYLQMRGQPSKHLPLDESLFMHHVFSARGFFAKRYGGGYTVVNTASIARLTFYPGLHAALPGVWQAACVAL